MSKPFPKSVQEFDSLPDSAFVRDTTVAALRGTSRATVWRHAAAGLIPKPKRLGPNTTAWNVGELRAAMKGVTS